MSLNVLHQKVFAFCFLIEKISVSVQYASQSSFIILGETQRVFIIVKKIPKRLLSCLWNMTKIARKRVSL